MEEYVVFNHITRCRILSYALYTCGWESWTALGYSDYWLTACINYFWSSFQWMDLFWAELPLGLSNVWSACRDHIPINTTSHPLPPLMIPVTQTLPPYHANWRVTFHLGMVRVVIAVVWHTLGDWLFGLQLQCRNSFSWFSPWVLKSQEDCVHSPYTWD